MLGNYLKQIVLLSVTIILLLISSPVVGFGEESVFSLDTVTVTAERFPVKEKESARFVTVVSADNLKETGANNLLDAINRTGGFAYKALAPLGISHGGMNSSLSIRGIEDGELILINGVPIQGAAGHAYDLNTIPLDQIERIEILKGAASTLYGADAMSGVINIITKKNRDVTSVKASVEFGSEGYQNHSASLSSPALNLGINYQHLGAQTEISRSFSKEYRYDLDSTDKYALNLGARLVENLYFDYIGSYYRTGFIKQYDDPDTDPEGTRQDHYKNFADVRYESSSFRAKVFGTFDEMQRDEYTDPEEPDDRNRSFNYGVEGDYKFDLPGWELNLGADWIYRGADYNNQYQRQYRSDYAFFTQAKKTFLDRLTATAGFREQFIDGASGAADYDRFLPSFGLTLKVTDDLNIFANTGKAFRAPTFNNLYYNSSFLVGNPDLGPEEGWTYEGGVKYDVAVLQVRFSVFNMVYENKIEIDRSNGYPLTYFNAGEYESSGVEWDVTFNPFYRNDGSGWNISIYTSGYAADPTAEDADGEEYQTGPKLQTTVGIGYAAEPLTLDLSCQRLAEREENLETSTVLDFYAKWKLLGNFMTFSVDNIFDETVQTSGDMTMDSSNRYVYYDVGRMIKVGYEVTF
jgi:iron complex outermembrane receptor protein